MLARAFSLSLTLSALSASHSWDSVLQSASDLLFPSSERAATGWLPMARIQIYLYEDLQLSTFIWILL
jgi:hypothetical protein